MLCEPNHIAQVPNRRQISLPVLKLATHGIFFPFFISNQKAMYKLMELRRKEYKGSSQERDHVFIHSRNTQFLRFVVPCIFNHSNKTPNQMQQSIVKFIALSYRHCSICFGHYCAHHQEPVKLPLQPLVSVRMWRWKCSQPWSVYQPNKPTTAENTSTSTFIRKPEAATAV